MIDEARAAPGPAARAPVLTRIARLLTDEQPAIFLYRYDVPALVAGTRPRASPPWAIASISGAAWLE